MSAVYANKFGVQLNDVARIIFIDERPVADPSLPMSQVTSTEVVMTLANAQHLRDVLTATLAKVSG